MSTNSEYPWNEADGEYKRLHISLIDLNFVQHHANHILANNLFQGHEKGNEDAYNQQTAFVSALIVAYGRIFTRSRGLPMFPMAPTQYNTEETKLHDAWMKHRHKLFAHSDAKSFHVLVSRSAVIKTIPMYHLRKAEVELALAMAEKLRRSIVTRINEIDRAR